MIFRLAAASFSVALLVSSARSADPAPPALSAADLASRLSAWQQDGASYARLRMEVKQPPGTTKSALQIQIKARRTKMNTEVVYQILWPKERKGEAVLLRKTRDRSASGSIFVPPDTVRPIDASEMKEPLFGSDLSYEDLVDNFFAWEHQAIVGTEDVDGVTCQILESKPGKGDRSSFASVRTWVDIAPARSAPHREIYGARSTGTAYRHGRRGDRRHRPPNPSQFDCARIGKGLRHRAGRLAHQTRCDLYRSSIYARGP